MDTPAETSSRGSAALIDQTLLCEASRLLRGDKYPNEQRLPDDFEMGKRWWPTSNVERLCHLATLLDSLLLYDYLYVLPAELPPDANELPLRRMLLQTKLVRMLDATALAPNIDKEFAQFLRAIPAADGSHMTMGGKTIIRKALHKIVTVSPEEHDAYQTPSTIDGSSYRGRNQRDIVIEGLVREYEGTLSHWWMSADRLRTNPLVEMGVDLIAKISYFGSGAVTSGVSHLRTFVYWRIAEHSGIPLVPSWRRMPQFAALAKHIRRSPSQQIYAAIARAHRSTVDEVLNDLEPFSIPLPPALALFLERLKRQDAYNAIFELRADWEPLRKNMRELAHSLSSSSSMAQRLAAKRAFQAVLRQLNEHHAYRESSRLEQAIAYAPDVIKPLANPADPEKYSADLIKKPLTWIREWWARRPLQVAFALRDALGEILSFETLAKETLRADFSNEDRERFRAHYDEYLKLYAVE